MAKSSSTKLEHKRFPTTTAGDQAANRLFAIEAARMLADDKCDDIVLLDVTGMSQLADFILIASGTSDRQMRSSGDDVAKLGETKHATKLYRLDADDRATWVLLDFVDIVVHIFEPNARAHYDLEMLWSDAPRIAWERPEEQNRDRAGLA